MAGDGMDRIKHVVVVMMENRSFDNLLGFLYADVNNSRRSTFRHRGAICRPLP